MDRANGKSNAVRLVFHCVKASTHFIIQPLLIHYRRTQIIITATRRDLKLQKYPSQVVASRGVLALTIHMQINTAFVTKERRESMNVLK